MGDISDIKSSPNPTQWTRNGHAMDTCVTAVSNVLIRQMGQIATWLVNRTSWLLVCANCDGVSDKCRTSVTVAAHLNGAKLGHRRSPFAPLSTHMSRDAPFHLALQNVHTFGPKLGHRRTAVTHPTDTQRTAVTHQSDTCQQRTHNKPTTNTQRTHNEHVSHSRKSPKTDKTTI